MNGFIWGKPATASAGGGWCWSGLCAPGLSYSILLQLLPEPLGSPPVGANCPICFWESLSVVLVGCGSGS